MKPAFDVPGVGRMAFIEEPGGAMIGWITPVNALTGARADRHSGGRPASPAAA